MLVNFCDACLKSDVTCSTVSTEGYEVTNLVNNSDKGFLAYSCIKPPLTIDFVFICNIQISHIFIWPQVGAQKSCGFQISVKSSNVKNQPFIEVATAFLQKLENGVLFYRKDIPNHSEIPVPSNFIRRYLKTFNVVNYTNALRLKIIKTDNSVPAIGKIEIWGSVSPKCGKDVVSSVTALWINRFNNSLNITASCSNVNRQKKEDDRTQVNTDTLDVPEEFLDPITWEIMTQPIILPCGKVIDQKTLDKHEHTEAVWGRSVSDPFTGIRFTDAHKPIAALHLKSRIDKFLLENSYREEIKKLPRVLGSKEMYTSRNAKIITCTTDSPANTHKSDSKLLKRTLPYDASNSVKRPFYGHALPIASVRNSNTHRIPTFNTTTETVSVRKSSQDKGTSTNSCKCCVEKIFYKLPCEHVICRKALLGLEKNQCTICNLEFQKSDPQRFHLGN